MDDLIKEILGSMAFLLAVYFVAVGKAPILFALGSFLLSWLIREITRSVVAIIGAIATVLFGRPATRPAAGPAAPPAPSTTVPSGQFSSFGESVRAYRLEKERTGKAPNVGRWIHTNIPWAEQKRWIF